MSVIFIIGLDGVSTQTILVLFAATAAATASRSDMSTGVLPIPQSPRTRLIRR
ncbi:hypothetical protein D3C85_1864330 [compost metagenome]